MRIGLSGVVAGLLTAVLLTRLVAGLARPWGWQKGASWVRQATSVTFAASGSHIIRVQVREDGAQIDQIVRSPRARALGWNPSLHSVAGNAARLFDEWRRGREAA